MEDFDVSEQFNSDEENVEEINRFVFFAFNVFEVCAQAFVLVVFVFHLLFRTVEVDGMSMSNTLRDKDRLFVVSELFHKPKRRDIVILNAVDFLDAIIVKRIIAMEGDVVDLRKEGNKFSVYVNNEKLEEDYIKEPIVQETFGDLTYPLTVPKGYVFVMGDNRGNSNDSRYFGAVNAEKVMGACIARVLPLKEFKIFK